MGDNLMNSAFQNYFSKNADRFGNASKEEKADFAVNKMVEWNQSQNGIKDRMDFINDNTSKTQLPNTVNTNTNIENGAKNLGSDVNSHVTGNTTFNPNSNESVRTGIESKGQEIRDSHVNNPELNSHVNNNVKEDGVVSKSVDNKSTNNGRLIDAKEKKDANKIDDNLMLKAVSGVDNGLEAVKQLGENFAGTKDDVNPDAQRYAKDNKTMNNATYTNAQQGENKLIKSGYFSDEINTSQLGKTSTEDLGRIYNYDKNNGKLSDSSKAVLKDELGKRGYDFNSNEFSSKYSPEEIKSHVIPNGDNSNPASDIQNTDKINKNKSDFSADFKPSF